MGWFTASRQVDRLTPPSTHHARVILEDLGAAMRAVTAGMSGQAVLDFGAGPAPYRALFSKFERYVTADIPGEDAELVIENGSVPAEDGAFDAVVSTQVLEHVPDPDSYLAEAHRLLRPGGTLVLSTHGIYWYHPVPVDLWRWTGPGLRRQIERCGFDVADMLPVLTAPAAGLNLFFQYGASALPGRLRPAWHFLAQWIVRLVNRSRLIARETNDAGLFVVVARARPLDSPVLPAQEDLEGQQRP